MSNSELRDCGRRLEAAQRPVEYMYGVVIVVNSMRAVCNLNY